MNDTLRDDRRHGFFIVYNDVLKQHGTELGPFGFAVYCVLLMYAGKSSAAFPSAKTIAETIGCSERKVRQALDKIVELGLATKTKRRREDGGWTSTLYAITDGQDIADQKPEPDPQHQAQEDLHEVQEGTAQDAQAHLHHVPTNKTPSEEDSLKKKGAADAAFSSSGSTKTSKPKGGGRKRDLHFEALAEMCGLQTSRLSRGNRAQLGKHAAGMARDGIDPEFIRACGRSWYSKKFGWKERREVEPPSPAQAAEWVGQEVEARKAGRVPEGAKVIDGKAVFWGRDRSQDRDDNVVWKI